MKRNSLVSSAVLAIGLVVTSPFVVQAQTASKPNSPTTLEELKQEIARLKEENAALHARDRLFKENARLRAREASQGAAAPQAAVPPTSPGYVANAAMPVYKAQPVAAAAPWSGFYAGLGVGTRSAVVDASVTSAFRGTQNLLVPPGCVGVGFANSGIPCPGGESLDNTAFRVSPYVGFNWQFAPQWVTGLEADFGWAKASRTLSGMYHPGGSISLMPGSGDSSFSVKTDWDASIRARLGFLVTPTFQVYGTGGPAWIHLAQTSNCPTSPFFFCGGGTIPVGNNNSVVFPTNGPASITDSTTRLGWTAGAGTEVLLGGNWIARAEYRYADFGTWSPTDVRNCISGGTVGCNVGAPVQTVTDAVHVRTHTATFGVAYKFDWGGGAGSSNAYAQAAGPLVYKAPPAAVASWSGLYLGAGIGTRSAVVDGSVPSAATAAGVFAAVNWTGPTTCGAGTGTVCPGGESLDNTAFRVNPYIGYNWQIGSQWLAGVEGDWGWANASRTLSGVWYPGGSPNFFQGQGDASFSVKTTWDASIRARLGFLVTPTFQVYGTGGPAWIHVAQTSNCPTAQTSNYCGSGFAQPQLPLDNFAPASITSSTTRLGWTIGAGAEMMLWRNWIARAEYRYADFGTWTNTDVRPCGFAPCAHGSLTVTDSLRLQTHLATLGLAYKLDWDR
jgi:outer membrane immunogenic protein